MLFTWDIAVTSGTTKADPKTQILKIAHGIISWVSVTFPPGCQRLVHASLRFHENKIVPSTEDMYLTGDTFPIEWNEYYEAYQPPYELKAELWNEDDTYAHTVTIRVAILPRKAVTPTSIADSLKEFFLGLIPRQVYK